MTGSLYREAALMDDDDDIYRPAGMGGEGWWDDAQKEVKRVAKKVQKSSAVRGLEKRAVKAGADVLRGAATAATDGLADSALTSLGAPEFAPLADQLINKGAKALEKKGTDYLDQKIDASGRGYGGVRYMSPAGGGLRLSSHRTQVGLGLRLAGGSLRLAGAGHTHGVPAGRHRMPDNTLMKNSDHMGRGHCGCGHGQRSNGLRLAGSGLYVQPGLVEGSGHAYC